MGRQGKKLWNICTSLLVMMVVLLTLFLAGVRLIGMKPYAVLSGSMEPTYHVGSLLYVKAVEHTTLEEGDVITFLLNEDTVATHRIVEVLPDENDASVLRYQTKGDANDSADGTPVHYKNVIGTPVFSIPYLGYVAAFIQNPPGIYFAVAVGALVLLLLFLPELFGERKVQKEKLPSKSL